MTEAAEAVERLRGDLERAQSERAAAAEQARRTADALVTDPTHERRLERDQAAAQIEVYDLRVEQARRRLKAAEVAHHQEAIAYLGAEHGTAQGEIGDIWSEIERATGALEDSCGRAAGLRREAGKRTGRARDHHALAGLPDEDRPSFMIALPRSNQIRGRLQKVIEQLQKLEVPNWH
jgi:hypothetical protein